MTKAPEQLIRLRKPTSQDGAAVWDLVRACKPLDENSLYCNLLQCDHFADTCVLAERAGQVVGWISGYIPPADEDTFFVWQVAVHESARGTGLGGRMLRHLMAREEAKGTRRLQTTITKDNAGSWALFRSFAKKQGGVLSDAPHFTQEDHFEGKHDTEHMVTIVFDERAERRAA